MQLNKRDLLTIAVLCIVFLGVATWNLGLTQTPISRTTFSAGESFTLNLGSPQNVGSLYFLLRDGEYNITVYYGSPDSWQYAASGTFSDYYKWKETAINRNTQYLKVDFSQSNSQPIIAEVALTEAGGQQIALTDISNSGLGSPNFQSLIDEQDKVSLPATYMTQTYFDEVYFTRTAEQYLNHEWPYEWTHPPLGKLIQAGGIAMFGFSPFGWRLMGVIFATLMIVVIYLIGKQLFGSWIGAFSAAFLLTFDFMHFTMGRMGTVDTYVVFFTLTSQLFFLIYFMNVVKNGWRTSVLSLFLAVIFFILGFSSKWVVLYAALGMVFLLAALRIRDVAKLKESIGRKYAAFFDYPFLLLLGFIAVAVGIYFLTYIPDMLLGRPFIKFPLTGPGADGSPIVNLQFAMYNYHATLVDTHQFQSPWWSWPLMINPLSNVHTAGLPAYVPLWLDISYLPNNVRSTISVMGNPVTWWVGFVAVIAVAIRAIRGRELILYLKKRLSRRPKAVTTPIPDAAQEALAPLSAMEQPDQPPTIQPVTSEIPPTRGAGRRWDLAAIFIASMFFFSWLSYALIPRGTFIYHYYIAVPYLCLAAAYLINKYWNTEWGKVLTLIFFMAVVVFFIMFFPVISGAPVSTDWIHKLKWFPSWYFAP